jgi:hypothetical protein
LRLPTVAPSRSTVALSQMAVTSARRCEMNSTERPRPLHSRTIANTRSARSDGSAAVISSSRSSTGSNASARARSSMRSVGSDSSETISVRSTSSCMRSSQPRTASGSASVRWKF